MNRQLFLFLVFSLTLLGVEHGYGKSRAARVFDYGRQITLKGTIGTRIYPGPPNYESVRTGDVAEHIWLLKLATPIDVRDDGDPTSNNEAETGVHEVQLVVMSPKHERLIEKSVGHPLRLTGSLFHALTGHHHLRVLMEVKKCAQVK